MFCSVASSSFWLPARVRVLRALSGVWADCLPACLLSICQGCGHSGKKGSEIARQHCESVCVHVCVLPGKVSAWHTILQAAPWQDPSASQNRGTGRSGSGTEWHKNSSSPPSVNKPHLLSVILVCFRPVIILLCYLYPTLCCLRFFPFLWEPSYPALFLSLTLSHLNWWAFFTDYIKYILITLSTEICVIFNFCIKSCLISISYPTYTLYETGGWINRVFLLIYLTEKQTAVDISAHRLVLHYTCRFKVCPLHVLTLRDANLTFAAQIKTCT